VDSTLWGRWRQLPILLGQKKGEDIEEELEDAKKMQRRIRSSFVEELHQEVLEEGVNQVKNEEEIMSFNGEEWREDAGGGGCGGFFYHLEMLLVS